MKNLIVESDLIENNAVFYLNGNWSSASKRNGHHFGFNEKSIEKSYLRNNLTINRKKLIIIIRISFVTVDFFLSKTNEGKGNGCGSNVERYFLVIVLTEQYHAEDS